MFFHTLKYQYNSVCVLCMWFGVNFVVTLFGRDMYVHTEGKGVWYDTVLKLLYSLNIKHWTKYVYCVELFLEQMKKLNSQITDEFWRKTNRSNCYDEFLQGIDNIKICNAV